MFSNKVSRYFLELDKVEIKNINAQGERAF